VTLGNLPEPTENSFVRALGAGHKVHAGQPELVNEVIDEVWAEATD